LARKTTPTSLGEISAAVAESPDAADVPVAE
jgi:hypothetical protein